MEFTLPELAAAFLYSVIFGICLGVLYEPLRIFHIAGFCKPVHYLIADIFYVFFCSFATYIFCLVFIEGNVRFFVIVGEFLGIWIFCTIEAPIAKKIYAPIINFFVFFLKKLLKFSRKLMYNIFCRTKRFAEGTAKFIYKVCLDGRKEKPGKKRKRSRNQRGKPQKEKA